MTELSKSTARREGCIGFLTSAGKSDMPLRGAPQELSSPFADQRSAFNDIHSPSAGAPAKNAVLRQ